MTAQLLKQLKQAHLTMHAMARLLDDSDYRRQYHQDLSPLGWHVGHCVFIETFWLREVILHDSSITADLDWLYIPENIVKPQRGPALPPREEHLQWCEKLSNQNAALFKQPPCLLREHDLNKNNYILKFILQHHSQHIETMAMVLAQRQLQLKPTLAITSPLTANNNIHYQFSEYPAGDFTIGNHHKSEAFDNELPPQQITLDQFLLADAPVNNADWLAFINDGGYQNECWWSSDGWQWCQENNITQPESWLQDSCGNFYAISATAANELIANNAVSGINYFEANAFTKWLQENSDEYTRVRLPHEYEWEVADKTGTLNRTGEVWEWCNNNFHPYPGFSAFPYENYSKPWFDNNHFSLRGGSEHTQPGIRRSSFRNFYNPDKRHIFSGLRLAMSAN